MPDSPLRSRELVAVRERHLARLQHLPALAAGEPAFVLWGIEEFADDVLPAPERFLAEALGRLEARVAAALDEAIFRPLSVTYTPRGVHFIDHIFGADVFRLESGWQTRTLSTPVGTLALPDVAADEGVRGARAFAEALLAREMPGVLLGMPVLSSVLNVAVNLYGQEILLALLEEPAAAQHDLQIIHDTILACHDWYLAQVPDSLRQGIVVGGRCQPPGRGQLCGCTTQLLPRALYEEFFAPFDEALLAHYPGGGMIHLCGAHTQHLPVWRAMPSLRAVQLNDRAAEELALYWHGLREDQVLYVNPCEEMPVERILAITGGVRTVIVADLPSRPTAR
jgi:hypothetical protein